MNRFESALSPEIITPTQLTVDQVRDAQAAITGHIHRTPLIRSETFSKELGTNVYFKLECMQKTGSFKPRGAFYKLLSLTPEQRVCGVVGVSGGNHAQGVAYAAAKLGVPATICMPATTPANYLDATRGYGANIVLAENIQAAFVAAEELASRGLVPVHPFDDPWIAAGQGTVALEILEDLPETSRIYISIGGGGLIAGMATVLRAARPEMQIIGVETNGADVMARSLAAGELVDMPAITSIARTLGSPRASEFTLEHVQRLVDEVLVVEDDETVGALQAILERTKVLSEPAAACCLAAARRQRDQFTPDDCVVILLCGGNVAVSDLCQWVTQRPSGR